MFPLMIQKVLGLIIIHCIRHFMYINKLDCVKVKEDQPNKNKKKELFNMHPSVHCSTVYNS